MMSRLLSALMRQRSRIAMTNKQKDVTEQLWAENERLTAQRDDYCRQLTRGIVTVRDLVNERDRLLKENDELKSLAAGDHEDNTRLRAALGRIAADDYRCENGRCAAWHIAREALAAGKPE